MKNRNYLSIDYQNNLSTPKLTLRPLNRYYFHPQKTFSNLRNYNNNIINLKTSFGKMVSIPDNNRYKTLFISSKAKNSKISKRNTYYNINNFSPQSTISVLSSKYSLNKEKYNRNKNSQISLKNIEFTTDKSSSRNNLNPSNTRYIFVGNKDPPKKNKLKKDNLGHNIELPGKNLIIMNNRTDINNSIDFFKNPNFKLTKKSKSNKILNYKRGKQLEDYDEKISEYNFDNYKINDNKHTINTLYLNENKDKKLIVELKTRKNTDNNEIIIKEIENTKDKMVPKKQKKIKNFELEADIRMFDPITLKSNEDLSKDFLLRKEKEKKILKKLFENEQLNKLIFKHLNNKDEENKENKSTEIKNIEDKEKNKKAEKLYSFFNKNFKLIKSLKHSQWNKLNNLYNNFFNKEFLKPGEYINFIANKIFGNIDSFRNKKYNDNKETIKDESYFNIIDIIENKDSIKEIISKHHQSPKSKSKKSKLNKFHFHSNLNINKSRNIKNSNSTSYIKNNTSFQKEQINNDENIKSSFDENKERIQTQNNNNNIYNTIQENEQININDKNSLQENNKIKSLKKKILNKKERKMIGKKIKSPSKGKKISKKKMKKLIKNNEKEENNEIKNDEENIENEEIEEDQDIYEDNMEYEKESDNEDYTNLSHKDDKNNTLIKRRATRRHSTLFKQNMNFKEDEKIESKPSKRKNKTEELLDELYEFKAEKITSNYIISDDKLNKINIKEELKIKLKENMKQVLALIKKENKTKYDYIKLNLCKKRIKYIIKKLSEKDTHKNLIIKPEKDLSFPENIEERKELYQLMRIIEEEIREELKKSDEYKYSESDSSSENDKEIDSKNIYEFLPIEEEEEEKPRKISIFDSPSKSKKKLIYDNLYLYRNEKEEKPVEIKKEVYDILNKEKTEENEEKVEEKEPIRKSPIRFSLRRRKFIKTRKQTMLIKLKNNEDDKIEKKEVITLDNKIDDFFEKIKKLKNSNTDEVDYEKILNELLWNRKENSLMEENIMKEIRLLNFFNYFQTTRKMNIIGKKYFRDKYAFNPPIHFWKNKK